MKDLFGCDWVGKVPKAKFCVCLICGEEKEHKGKGLCIRCHRHMYYNENSLLEIERAIVWSRKNPEKKKKARKKWSDNNKERIAWYRRKYGKRKHKQHEEYLAMKFGYICQGIDCPGGYCVEELQIDHIHPINEINSYQYENIDSVYNLQFLCPYCNGPTGKWHWMIPEYLDRLHYNYHEAMLLEALI